MTTNELIIPDMINPIVGFRKWDVDADGVLRGLSYQQIWEPRRAMRAVCVSGDSLARHADEGIFTDAPIEYCSCGIYAHREPSDTYTGGVSGEVWLWGRVIEHEGGYRAEFAYPKRLTVRGSEELAEKVRVLYGVEVEQQTPLDQMWTGTQGNSGGGIYMSALQANSGGAVPASGWTHVGWMNGSMVYQNGNSGAYSTSPPMVDGGSDDPIADAAARIAYGDLSEGYDPVAEGVAGAVLAGSGEFFVPGFFDGTGREADEVSTKADAALVEGVSSYRGIYKVVKRALKRKFALMRWWK